MKSPLVDVPGGSRAANTADSAPLQVTSQLSDLLTELTLSLIWKQTIKIEGRLTVWVSYLSGLRCPMCLLMSVATKPGCTWLTAMSSLWSASISLLCILVRALRPILDTM